ncbi:lytic murein transglycosylase B [Idiomarina tyrosinivorans]|uniref:Lytic murein transglycosylase B n=1 Tax=Idiomarina tyrosinivorans TaxID=1445662 RepID=A0A432ZRI3_9GAMM|nr:lytic murein transglycosylase B [Idiomarina tyrosinivorans]RUO80448.1 lytic murein transglycosylase B [Idiomarina tyrosinivorans]
MPRYVPLIAATFALFSASCWGQATKADVQQAFIEQLANDSSISREQIREWLDSATVNQDVLRAIKRPWEAKPWYQYYPIFLTEKRLQQGKAFQRRYQQALQRAEDVYGVPQSLIVAIIGVETFYGQYKGKYSVLDSLYTLGFHYPPRAEFFRSELAEFLTLANNEGWDINSVRGSYAGAMGYGQFISSSYRHYAVDFDGDGRRDLMNNPVDAIGSIANYFAEHGYKKGEPVAFDIADDAKLAQFKDNGLKPTLTQQQLRDQGIAVEQQVPNELTVIPLQTADGTNYWLGFHNFYVITRYNHSPLYAMVVYQLSQQLASDK